MFTAMRAIISPRRRRSSMKRVVTMPQVGIHEPRWSPGGSAGIGVGAGPGAPTSVMVGHSASPRRLVTSRNHDSSEA